MLEGAKPLAAAENARESQAANRTSRERSNHCRVSTNESTIRGSQALPTMTPTTQAKIHIERMMYRSSIAVQGDSAASYALIKLIPTGCGTRCRSASTWPWCWTSAARCTRKTAPASAGSAASRRRHHRHPETQARPTPSPSSPSPTTARWSCRRRRCPRKRKIEDVIQKVDMFDVDPGGTAMDQGISLGLSEVEKNARRRQAVAGARADRRRDLRRADLPAAGQAGRPEEDPASTSSASAPNGTRASSRIWPSWPRATWHYIDVNRRPRPSASSSRSSSRLAAAGFLNVEMHLRAMKDIKIKRVRMVVPEIKELTTDRAGGAAPGGQAGYAGTRQAVALHSRSEFAETARRQVQIADLEITFDPGTGKRETTGPVPLEMSYTSAGNGYINAEVAKHIDEVQIFELNKNLQAGHRQERQQEEVQRVAQMIEKKAEVMGPRPPRKRCWPSRCCRNSTPAAASPRRRSWPWTTPPARRKRPAILTAGC